MALGVSSANPMAASVASPVPASSGSANPTPVTVGQRPAPANAGTSVPFMGTSAPFMGKVKAVDTLSPKQKLLFALLKAKLKLSESQGTVVVDTFRRRNGAMSLGDTVVDLGYATDTQMVKLIAEIYQPDGIRLAQEIELTGAPRDVARLLEPAISRARCALPIARMQGGNGLMVAIHDPEAPLLSQVKHALGNYNLKFVLAPRRELMALIESKLVDVVEFTGGADVDGNNMAAFVEGLFKDAALKRCTDLHVCPEETIVELKYRIDGDLQVVSVLDQALKERFASALKIATTRADDGRTRLPAQVGGLDISKTQHPQGAKAARRYGSRRFTMRFSIIPSINGESFVVRFLDQDATVGDLETLGMLVDHARLYRQCVKMPDGLIINCGPTGHGKSTTLAAAVQYIDIRTKKLCTVENPVEYRFRGVQQFEVEPSIPGRGWVDYMRELLRHNPNYILIGEMRDKQTMHIAVEASNTGHMVLSTLHSNTAITGINRLLEYEIEPAVITLALRLLLAQRLVRRLCSACKVPHERDDELCEQHGLLWKAAEARGLVTGEPHYFTPKGCDQCKGTGYKGRGGIFELRRANAALNAQIIVQGRQFNSARAEEVYAHTVNEALHGDGGEQADLTGRTLMQDGMIKAAMGWFAPEDVMAAIYSAL